MKGQRWLIAVDTGGTFTDCWGQAPDGTRSRCKLLSSGRLRTVLAEVPQENVLVLRDKWGTQNDFFRGFTVEAVVDGETWLGTVVAWDSRTGQITLDRPQPMSASAGQVIELFTGEAAPVVGVRLLTGTMWGQKFPAMEFRSRPPCGDRRNRARIHAGLCALPSGRGRRSPAYAVGAEWRVFRGPRGGIAQSGLPSFASGGG